MKKVLSIAVMMVFVAGMALAQNPPKKDKEPVKTEKAKADTTKKVAHHKTAGKPMNKKK